jgi:T5SS/PEP-CTERM-associated repeat protein
MTMSIQEPWGRQAVLAVVAASGLASAPAMGVDYFRTIPGGDFRVPQYWAPFNPNPPFLFGPGGANDTANFNLGFGPESRYTVTNVYGLNERLTIHHDAVRLVLSDDYTLGQNDNAFGLRVGTVPEGTGDLVVSGSGVFRPGSTFIGVEPGATGQVTLDGAQWDGSASIANIIGYFGPGTLTIQNGGAKAIPQAAFIGLNSTANGTVTVAGSGSSWTQNQLVIGWNGNGSMTINSGGSVQTATDVLIGTGSAVTGSVMVSGAGSSWTVGDELRVGSGGTVWLEIEAGGSVSSLRGRAGINAGSFGSVVVAGAGSSWNNTLNIAVGESGDGSMAISAGASVTSTVGEIAIEPGSSGHVLVTGAYSSWHNSNALRVGLEGDATLTIEDGGSVRGRFIPIAVEEGSSGTVMVTGEGSILTLGELALDALNVGFRGEGALTISDGGRVTGGGFATIGFEGTGVVNVMGPGAELAMANLIYVGGLGGGDGTLNISAGGAVSTINSVVAPGEGSSGVVTIEGAGSKWTTTGDLTIGREGPGLFEIHGGTVITGSGAGSTAAVEPHGRVDLLGGVMDVRGAMNVVGGQFNFLGGVLHVDTFGGNLVNQGGMLAPGHISVPIGHTHVVGNYTQEPAGRLEIEINGVGPGRYDTVLVERTATLGGRIELRLLGFEPEYGDVFQVLETNLDQVVGIFDTVGGSLPLPGLGMAVTYGPKAVRVVAAIPGDANLDGAVTIADLGMLAANWQMSGKTWVDGDFNGDGQVTIADLGVLAAHWQWSVDGSVAGVSFDEALGMFDVFDGVVVPEPGVVGLIGFGLLALKRDRQRHPGR